MGMGMMDALARLTGSGGGMGMMGQMQQSPAVGRSLVQALMAKHAAAMPTAKAGDGIVAPPSGGIVGKPDLGPAAVNLGPPPGTPVAPPPGAAVSIGDNGAALHTAAAATPTLNKPNGLFDRIGDFLHSDEGRAALLRSGAATLQGGLGSGIEAGAGFVDQRRHEREAQAASAAEMGLKQQEMNNSYNLGLGRLGIEGEQVGETARHNRAGEGNDQYRTQAEIYKHNNPSGDTRLRVAEDRFQHITPSGDTQTTQAGENYRHDNASGDTALTQSSETARNTQDNQTTLMRDRIAHAPTVSMHAHYTTTPEKYARNGPRLRPSEVRPVGDQGLVSIASDADYAALASGTKFKGPDGQVRVKP